MNLSKIGSSSYCVLAFLLGAVRSVKIDLGGQLLLSEIFCVIFCIVNIHNIFNSPYVKLPYFRKVIALFAVTVIAWVLSDLYNATAISDFVRGWARLGFIFVTFITMFMLIHRCPRSVLYFALGIFSVVFIKWISSGLSTGLSGWRSVGYSFTLTTVTVSGYLLKRYLATIPILLAAMVNMIFDYRTMAGAALVSFVNSLLTNRISKNAILWLLAAGVALVTSIAIYDTIYLDSGNASRGAESNSKRLAYHMTGLNAIAGSPVVGYGSWAYSAEHNAYFVQQLKFRRVKLSRTELGELSIIPRIPAHSVILQAWVEGGFFAMSFFVFALYLQIHALILLFTKLLNYPFSSAYSFILILASWDLCFTPLGTGIRSTLALALAIALHVMYLRASQLRSEFIYRSNHALLAKP